MQLRIIGLFVRFKKFFYCSMPLYIPQHLTHRKEFIHKLPLNVVVSIFLALYFLLTLHLYNCDSCLFLLPLNTKKPNATGRYILLTTLLMTLIMTEEFQDCFTAVYTGSCMKTCSPIMPSAMCTLATASSTLSIFLKLLLRLLVQRQKVKLL